MENTFLCSSSWGFGKILLVLTPLALPAVLSVADCGFVSVAGFGWLMRVRFLCMAATFASATTTRTNQEWEERSEEGNTCVYLCKCGVLGWELFISGKVLKLPENYLP